ncbi:MAG: hypothetical protein JXN60_09760 [Lentisphaerae bacterium]|nr:hypothetical protein [Lentisphaerota bacterium]
MKKVLIPTKLDSVAAAILKDADYDVVQESNSNIVALAKTHSDTHALIVRSEKVTAEIIDALPNLKVIVRAGAGYNTIDIKYARKKDIDVMNTPGANSNAVAEEVIALMLADARYIVPADASMREGKWEKNAFMGHEISGKTVGILGLGNIGQLVVKRLRGFDVTILGCDPIISEERARELQVRLVDRKTLFSESDYVTLHIPENDETRGAIDEQLLALMKKGSTIINCARAGIIDENALRKVKKEKGIRFLNDVYQKDSEGKKTVADIADIMLPHLGASTFEANFKAAKRAAEQLIDFDTKGITSFIVNRAIPDGLDEAYCELANTLARLCHRIMGEKATTQRIETSFYGLLEPFADWLLVPIVAGIWDEFDSTMDYKAASDYLAEMGIEYENRLTDAHKGYENSMTVDLTGAVDSGTLKRISVRGTLTEGNLMVSRINEFDKLYFEPKGHTAFFLYDDRPGVLGAIGVKLAGRGINIEDMRNPHDAKTNRSLAIMKVNQPVPADLIQEISKEINSVSAFAVKL